MGLLDPPALSPTRAEASYSPIQRFAIWGDSLAKYGEGIDPYLVGPTMGALRISGPEAQKRVYSHPGSSTTALLAFTSEITGLDPAPDSVLVQAGTNDVIGAITLSTIMTNLQTIYRRFEGRGCRVIMSTIPPLGGPFQHNGKQGAARQVNIALRELASSSGRLLVDPWAALVDASTQRYQSAYDSGDNVHPSTTGLVAWANKVRTDLTPYLGPVPTVTELSNGAGDNKFNNAAMLTGNGNIGATPTAGLAGSLGATSSVSGITPSLVADAGPVAFNWQTFTNSTPGGAQTFYQATSYAVTPGNKIRVSLRYRRTGGTSGACRLIYSMYHGGTVDLNVPLNGDNGMSAQVADSAFVSYFTVPTNATNGQLQILLPANDGVFAFACPTIYDLTALGLA